MFAILMFAILMFAILMFASDVRIMCHIIFLFFLNTIDTPHKMQEYQPIRKPITNNVNSKITLKS